MWHCIEQCESEKKCNSSLEPLIKDMGIGQGGGDLFFLCPKLYGRIKYHSDLGFESVWCILFDLSLLI